MIPLFGRPVPEIAMIDNGVLDFIYEQHGHKLTQWNNAILNPAALQGFKKNLKIGLNQVGKMYFVCAILRNALTCHYSNSTSKYFGLEPPTLQEYFA